jgi:hypothetical protein
MLGVSHLAGLLDLPKGASVARSRPITSDVQQMLGPSGLQSTERGAGAALSPAAQRALHLSAPLSSAQFKTVGQLVERGELPMRRLFRRRR